MGYGKPKGAINWESEARKYQADNKRLRDALKSICEVMDKSPVLIYQRMEQIAAQALKEGGVTNGED